MLILLCEHCVLWHLLRLLIYLACMTQSIGKPNYINQPGSHKTHLHCAAEATVSLLHNGLAVVSTSILTKSLVRISAYGDDNHLICSRCRSILPTSLWFATK